MARIFISYRRADSEGYVGRLYDQLLKYYDESAIFLDVEAIKAGADFESVIMSELDSCEVFIPVIGPNWVDILDNNGNRRLLNQSDYVRREISRALQQKKQIFPVLIKHAIVPKENDLPDEIKGLSKLNAADLSHIHFREDVEKLVESIGGGYGKVIILLRDLDKKPTRENLFRFPASRGYYVIFHNGIAVEQISSGSGITEIKVKAGTHSISIVKDNIPGQVPINPLHEIPGIANSQNFPNRAVELYKIMNTKEDKAARFYFEIKGGQVIYITNDYDTEIGIAGKMKYTGIKLIMITYNEFINLSNSRRD